MKSFIFLAFFLAALFVAFASAQVNISHTLVYGSGLNTSLAGEPTFFYIQPRDNNYNNITTCSTTYQISLVRGTESRAVSTSCTRGRIVASYTTKNLGLYQLTISYANVQIPSSPYYPVAFPGPIYPGNCIASGIQDDSVVGDRVNFTITTYDTYNNLNTTKVPFSQWSIVLSGAANTKGRIYDFKNGTYYGYYQLEVAGGYSLTIGINNGYIKNSPFDLFLEPGPIYPPNCVATGSGIRGAAAGDVTDFVVQAYDQYNNELTDCSADFSNWNAYLIANNNTVPVNVTDCDNGAYNLEYVAFNATTYQLYVYINNQSISNNGKNVVITPGRNIYGPNIIAQGDGLYSAVAGVPASVFMTPADRYGNLINTCNANWNDFDLQLQAANNGSITCSGTVVSCVQGVFHAQWSCYTATNYVFDIFYQNQAIRNSPFSPYVVPGAISGPNTMADGPGLTVANAGVMALFNLDAYDQYNNRAYNCTDPGFVILAYSNGIAPVEGQVLNCTNGTFLAGYTVTIVDDYVLKITLGGNQVGESPYYPTAFPGYPAYCNASGDGLTSAQAGQPAYFNLSCADEFGNYVTQCLDLNDWFVGLASLDANVVVLNGTAIACQNYTNEEAAVTTFSYLPTQSGQYRLSYGYDDDELAPSIVTVSAGPFDASNSIAVGEGVESQYIPAGQNTSFYIIARDAYGNNLTECLNVSQLNVVITPRPTTTPVFIGCDQSTNYLVQVQYTTVVAGRYSVAVRYQGLAIENSPYGVAFVAGPIDINHITATGAGLTYATAGANASVFLAVADRYGNVITTCTNQLGDFSLVLNGESDKAVVNGVVFNCINGVYYAQYVAYSAQYYRFNIQFQQQDIPNSPFRPLVVPGASSDANAVVYAQTPVTAGAGGVVYVNTRDLYNNPINNCPTPAETFYANITGVRTSQIAKSSQCVNGTYSIFYNVTVANQQDTIYVYGIQNQISTEVVDVVPGDLYAPNSDAQALNGTAGQVVYFSIQTRDIWFNDIHVCTANQSLWSVEAPEADTGAFSGEVYDCQSGVYLGWYSVGAPGYYDVHIMYDGRDVINSPFDLYFGIGIATYANATGEGLYSQTIVAGEIAYFTIQLYNQYKVIITDQAVCDQNISISTSITPPFSAYPENLHINLTTCDHGLFRASYNATTAQTYTADVQFNGAAVNNSPFHPTVIPAAFEYSQTIVIGLGANVTNSRGNGSFFIQTRDRFGNNEIYADSNLFSVSLAPSCAESTVVLASNNSGLIEYDYSVTEGGIYCVSILYQGYYVPLADSSIHVVGGTGCSDNGNCNDMGYCFRDRESIDTGNATYSCSCFQGQTGSDCTVVISSKYPLSVGPVVGLIIGLGILFFIIGVILGFFIFRHFNRHSDDRTPLFNQ